MALPIRTKIAIKCASYCLIYSPLHFLYDWFPSPFARLVGGTGESIFQHMKIGFWSWLFASGVERFWNRASGPKAFIASRAFGSAIAPLSIMIVWYVVAAAFGPMPSALLEVASAFAILVTTGFGIASAEAELERLDWGARGLGVLIGFFGAVLAFFALYSDSTPWVDLFAEPIVGYNGS
jgi:hypothetical protein